MPVLSRMTSSTFNSQSPSGHGLEIMFEAAKFVDVSGEVAGYIFDQDDEDMLHSMHIDAGHAFVQCFQLLF